MVSQIKLNAWDDKVDVERWVGEDNYQYVRQDLVLSPSKPTLDGEPSYELIPHGLHDSTKPYWQACDVRRYAYWSMLSGAAGHTYGDNASMQFWSHPVIGGASLIGDAGKLRPVHPPGWQIRLQIQNRFSIFSNSPLHLSSFVRRAP